MSEYFEPTIEGKMRLHNDKGGESNDSALLSVDIAAVSKNSEPLSNVDEPKTNDNGILPVTFLRILNCDNNSLRYLFEWVGGCWKVCVNRIHDISK